MEDPFKIALKAFFGVATGVGILILSFYVIEEIGYSIDSFIENQEQKQREKEREEREFEEWRKRLSIQRAKKLQEDKRELKKRLIEEGGKGCRHSWTEEKIRGCFEYPGHSVFGCVEHFCPLEKKFRKNRN